MPPNKRKRKGQRTTKVPTYIVWLGAIYKIHAAINFESRDLISFQFSVIFGFIPIYYLKEEKPDEQWLGFSSAHLTLLG